MKFSVNAIAKTWTLATSSLLDGQKVRIQPQKSIGIRYQFTDNGTPPQNTDVGAYINDPNFEIGKSGSHLWVFAAENVIVEIEVIETESVGATLPAGAATEAKQDLANELDYREATKTAIVKITWEQYSVLSVVGWAVGVNVGDLVYKQIDKMTNVVSWIKSDGVTQITIAPDEKVNVESISLVETNVEAKYQSTFNGVLKERTAVYKKGTNNFGEKISNGEWV
jgi:hypothetical protein